jgi:hypothetical protein
MSTVNIFNTSDSGAANLKQYGLDDRTFAVIDALIAPGESGTVDAKKWEALKGNYTRLITLGALAVGQPPASYLAAKANKHTGASKGS